MKTEIHSFGDIIDIFQESQVEQIFAKHIGQIEENVSNNHPEWKHWRCHNFKKNPVETQYFDTFKEALLWLENII